MVKGVFQVGLFDLEYISWNIQQMSEMLCQMSLDMWRVLVEPIERSDVQVKMRHFICTFSGTGGHLVECTEYSIFARYRKPGQDIPTLCSLGLCPLPLNIIPSPWTLFPLWTLPPHCGLCPPYVWCLHKADHQEHGRPVGYQSSKRLLGTSHCSCLELCFSCFYSFCAQYLLTWGTIHTYRQCIHWSSIGCWTLVIVLPAFCLHLACQWLIWNISKHQKNSTLSLSSSKIQLWHISILNYTGKVSFLQGCTSVEFVLFNIWLLSNEFHCLRLTIKSLIAPKQNTFQIKTLIFPNPLNQIVNMPKQDWAAVWIGTLWTTTKHVSPDNFENKQTSHVFVWLGVINVFLPKVNCVWTLCLSCNAAGPNQEWKTTMGCLSWIYLGGVDLAHQWTSKVSHIQELHPKSFSYCLLVQKLFPLEENT